MLAVVVSRADEASVHVGEHLLDLAGPWETSYAGADDREAAGAAGTTGGEPAAGPEDSLGPGGTVHRTEGIAVRVFDELHLDLERAADAFADPDMLVFASRHAGDTGPLLTAHHTGNFGPADHGGEAGELARCAPVALRRVRRSLAHYAPPDYDVGIEATHHGPSEVGVPSLFAEVGSDEAQWADPDAARAVARAVLDLRGVAPLSPPEDGRRRHVVGFGGGHYAPRFDRVLAETDWGVGHVAPDWALSAMGDPERNRDVLERAFERSAADVALVEEDREALADVVRDLGRRVVSETWLRETAGVPLGLVEELEAALIPVEEGLRFGEPARTRQPADASPTADGDDDRTPTADPADGPSERGTDDDPSKWTTVDLPTGLLEAARGVDRDAASAAVAAETIAFVTEQNGAVVVGPAAVASRDARDRVVDGLADVLRREYDEVTRDGDVVLARREEFDPALAREAGVPEGPAFGRLSDGDPVEVDGRRVDPASVRVERERRFDC